MTYSQSEFYIINVVQILSINKCLMDSNNLAKVNKAIELLIACLPLELQISIIGGLK